MHLDAPLCTLAPWYLGTLMHSGWNVTGTLDALVQLESQPYEPTQKLSLQLLQLLGKAAKKGPFSRLLLQTGAEGVGGNVKAF